MNFTTTHRKPSSTSRARQNTSATSASDAESLSSRAGVYVFALALFTASAFAVSLFFHPRLTTISVLLAVGVGLAIATAVRIAPQWESVIITRLGKFNRVAGPGLYLVIPIIEQAPLHIDQRTTTTTFYAEEALTADLVPVDVDAVLFWVVWDSSKAFLEVQNYAEAVACSAQTALRDAIGGINLDELSPRRQQLDEEIQERLDAKCTEWGISITSVEIRNISVPEELQNALSKEAQATRDCHARMLIAEAEKEISSLYVEAAEVYAQNELSMQIRTMNAVNDSVRDNGSMVVVPSAFSEGFTGSDESRKAALRKER